MGLVEGLSRKASWRGWFGPGDKSNIPRREDELPTFMVLLMSCELSGRRLFLR